jgi:nucleoside-diphosphate-sugar epimerase
MRMLVAGGAGFVGSHLVDELAAQGHEVVVVDDFSTGSLENLAPIASRRIRIHPMDVADAPPTDRFDRVYHLASPASPDAYGRRPIDTLMVNSVGTRRLLDIARASRARFLLASTSEVYGDPLEHPQAETYWGNVDPIGPRSQYDEGKRFAEALTIAFVRQHEINARIVRIFNAYGPRMAMDDGRMPSAFIVAALRGDPIPVHGDGTQTRSLCYVEDTAAGLIAAMERGMSGEVYNIGRPDEVTVLEFAERVRRAAGSRSPIVQIAGRPQDIRRRRPDPTKTERALGWSPRTSLDQGLDRTIAWYRSRLTVGERIA